MTAQLVIVRHGQSQWNLENRFTGWVDVPLTAEGEAEARRAGAKIAGLQMTFDRAFTSALQRAQKTLDLILQAIGQNPPISKSEFLNERHYGDLQGKNKKETADQYGDEQVHLWRRSFDVAPPGGESLKTCRDRVLPYFKKEIEPELALGKTILIVAHGNSLRALMMELENLSGEQILKRELSTGLPRVYSLEGRPGKWKIISVRDLS